MTRAIAWFARNHVAANLLMALLVIGGIASFWRVQVKSFPDVDLPIISVGGIDSVEEAQIRFELGASLIQLYTGRKTFTAAAVPGDVTRVILTRDDVLESVIIQVARPRAGSSSATRSRSTGA